VLSISGTGYVTRSKLQLEADATGSSGHKRAFAGSSRNSRKRGKHLDAVLPVSATAALHHSSLLGTAVEMQPNNSSSALRYMIVALSSSREVRYCRCRQSMPALQLQSQLASACRETAGGVQCSALKAEQPATAASTRRRASWML
jgi:hypothetical protein